MKALPVILELSLWIMMSSLTLSLGSFTLILTLILTLTLIGVLENKIHALRFSDPNPNSDSEVAEKKFEEKTGRKMLFFRHLENFINDILTGCNI